MLSRINADNSPTPHTKSAVQNDDTEKILKSSKLGEEQAGDVTEKEQGSD